MLISTTTSASATNTGDIAISPDKKYLVTMDIDNATNAGNNVSIRFNSSNTAAGYAWSGESRLFNTTSTLINDGDESDSEISLMRTSTGYVSAMEASNSGGFLKGKFDIDTNKVGTSASAFVHGEFVCKSDAAAFYHANFGGMNLEDLTIASFELVFSQNAAFTIKVYELK
jgi:hypothetical protein